MPTATNSASETSRRRPISSICRRGHASARAANSRSSGTSSSSHDHQGSRQSVQSCCMLTTAIPTCSTITTRTAGRLPARLDLRLVQLALGHAASGSTRRSCPTAPRTSRGLAGVERGVASIPVAEPCPPGVSTAAVVLRRPVPFSLLRRDDEARLVQRARDGDDHAFAELYRRHFAAVYRVAFLVCHDAAAAEDIAQEAFLAAVRNLDRFDRGRPVRPWLARIASNRAIDWVRARSRRAESALDDVAAAAADRAAGPDDAQALIAACRPSSARSSPCGSCST